MTQMFSLISDHQTNVISLIQGFDKDWAAVSYNYTPSASLGVIILGHLLY